MGVLVLTEELKDIVRIFLEEKPGKCPIAALLLLHSASFFLQSLPSVLQQHKRRLYMWTSPEGQYQNQFDYIICSQRWRSSIQSEKKEDWELTVVQIMSSFLPNSELN